MSYKVKIVFKYKHVYELISWIITQSEGGWMTIKGSPFDASGNNYTLRGTSSKRWKEILNAEINDAKCVALINDLSDQNVYSEFIFKDKELATLFKLTWC